MGYGGVLGYTETQMWPRHKARAVPRNERGGFGRVTGAIGRFFWRGISLAVSLWSLIGVLSISVMPLVSAKFHDPLFVKWLLSKISAPSTTSGAVTGPSESPEEVDLVHHSMKAVQIPPA